MTLLDDAPTFTDGLPDAETVALPSPIKACTGPDIEIEAVHFPSHLSAPAPYIEGAALHLPVRFELVAEIKLLETEISPPSPLPRQSNTWALAIVFLPVGIVIRGFDFSLDLASTNPSSL